MKQDLVAQALAAQGYSQLQRREQPAAGAARASQTRYPGAATAVEVLYTGRDPFTQKVFVNRGTEAGIKAGEAVIDEIGRRRARSRACFRTWPR